MHSATNTRLANELLGTVPMPRPRGTSIFQAPTPQRQLRRADLWLAAIGIADQALRGLMQLRQLHELESQPRSLLFDSIQLYNRFDRNKRFIAQLPLLVQAASCAQRLGSEWRDVLRRPAPITGPRKAVRYYTIGSLALASIVIPWLWLRTGRFSSIE